MKLYIVLAVLTLALLSVAVKAQSKAEIDVRKLERAWLDAYEKHDKKAMQAIVADDFLITFADGSQQTKRQIMEMIARPLTPENAGRFWTEKVQARVYGNTVILSGRVISEFKQRGETKQEESLYTDTYVRRNGIWQVVASHLSNAPQVPPKN